MIECTKWLISVNGSSVGLVDNGTVDRKRDDRRERRVVGGGKTGRSGVVVGVVQSQQSVRRRRTARRSGQHRPIVGQTVDVRFVREQRSRRSWRRRHFSPTVPEKVHTNRNYLRHFRYSNLIISFILFYFDFLIWLCNSYYLIWLFD